jgi:hypothetical protein
VDGAGVEGGEPFVGGREVGVVVAGQRDEVGVGDLPVTDDARG